jgi:hypothetical protein
MFFLQGKGNIKDQAGKTIGAKVLHNDTEQTKKILERFTGHVVLGNSLCK